MARNQIKGITVEIGGDTTKLGKALENVNRKSSELSSELGEINKMLKFDPGNADLLAQKQKVLAEAVANTSEKLKTLKEAEAQVQEQFERGEVSAEQVRALQREIMATERKLGSYEKAAKDAADAAEQLGKPRKKDSLSKTVADQTAKLKKLKGEYADVIAAEGKNSTAAQKLATEIKDLSDELKKNEKQLNDAEKEADELTGAYDKLSGSAEKASTSSSGVGSAVGGVAKKGLAVVAGLATAAVGGLTASAEASREYRAEMGKLDAAFTSSGHSTGTATEAYKKLQGVIGETDQSVEAAQQIALLADSEKDVAQWSDLAAGVVGKFGDALQPETFFEAANETLKLGESTGAYTQMLEGCGLSVEEFNTGLAACSTEAEKQAYMLEVTKGALGSAGEAYKKNNAEVIRANEANEAWMASMGAIGGSMEPIITDIKTMGASLLSELVPGVKSVAEAFRGVLSGDAGAADALGSALSGLVTQVLNKLLELLPTVAQVAVSLVTTLATTIVSMLPQVLDVAIQLVLTLLQGFTSAYPTFFTAVAEMIPKLASVLAEGVPLLLQAAVQLLMTLVQAIPPVLVALVGALPDLLLSIINALLTAIPQVLDAAIQLLISIVDAIPVIVAKLVPALPEIIYTIILGLLDCIPQLLDAAVDLLMAIVEAIPLICVELIKALPQIWKTVFSFYKTLPGKLWDILVSLVKNIVRWITDSQKKTREGWKNILKACIDIVKDLPGKVWTWLVKVVTKVSTWVVNMTTKAREMGSKFLSNVVTFFAQLPGKIWSWLSNAASKVVSWGSSLVTKGKAAVKKLVTVVVNTVKSLPSKMATAGKNLVQGLWKGISGAYTWLKSKIRGWVGNVMTFLKKLFGINSPSKKTEWMGEMLDAGLAEGVEGAEDQPLTAMRRLSEGMLDEADMLNGTTLERRINHAFADPVVSNAESGLLDKLDKILAAIERGQVLTIDGKALIGSTVNGYDSAMGQRRALAARGAL